MNTKQESAVELSFFAAWNRSRAILDQIRNREETEAPK